jgi:2-haloacid dehalogenase
MTNFFCSTPGQDMHHHEILAAPRVSHIHLQPPIQHFRRTHNPHPPAPACKDLPNLSLPNEPSGRTYTTSLTLLTLIHMPFSGSLLPPMIAVRPPLVDLRGTFVSISVSLHAMTQTRKAFLLQLAGMTAATQVPLGNKLKLKALAFDAFPIFDPRPVFALAEELFPGKGQELSNTWKTRQFEYQWLRALSNTYQDFRTVTQDALVFAAQAAKVDLTEQRRTQLMDAYLHLPVWPDVLPALHAFKAAGLQLIFLSNMTEKMLRQNMKGNGLDHLFDDVLSTDLNQSYKPSPKAYQLAPDHLHLQTSQIGFVAFAGWDAFGAKTFGYPTYWVNRQGQPKEELGLSPDWMGANLQELVSFLSL